MSVKTIMLFALASAAILTQNAAASVNKTLAEFSTDIGSVSASVITLFEACADFLMQPPFIYFMGLFVMMIGIRFIPSILKSIMGAIGKGR